MKRGSRADALGRCEIKSSMMAPKGGNPDILRIFIYCSNLLAQDVSSITAAHHGAQKDNDSCDQHLGILNV